MMRSFYLLPLFLPLLAGCGGGTHKIVPVSGHVTLHGKPLANAAVTFQPMSTEGSLNPGPGSGGITDAEGRYTLTVIGTQTKGTVVGKHHVLITHAQQDDSKDDRPKRPKQLPTKRTHDKPKHEFDVPPGGTDSADFELSSP